MKCNLLVSAGSGTANTLWDLGQVWTEICLNKPDPYSAKTAVVQGRVCKTFIMILQVLKCCLVIV